MRNDADIVRRMVQYCADIDNLMDRFERDFDKYKSDISFQYSCNMCIIQIGEWFPVLRDQLEELL